ncbi:MAG TPA: hypothetical protein VNT51_01665, partial [Miltoncostaeaceae bacterium]|nr:hypothetical protein [Miltoncostaeaceae bacterium]
LQDVGADGRCMPPVRLAGIVAAADVLEALTADRPYRAGVPVGDARALMARDAGRAICPRVTDVLHALRPEEPAPAEAFPGAGRPLRGRHAAGLTRRPLSPGRRPRTGRGR